MIPVEHATTWLFVPASRPDRFDKATASGADVVVLDLEDGVAVDDKAEGRAHVAARLAAGRPAAVRVNGVGSAHHDADVEAVTGLPGLGAVLLPMAESPDAIAALHGRLGQGVAIVPQIETAVGLVRAAELAAPPGVVRLALGHLDLAVDLDASPTGEIIAFARAGLVVASRVAGRPGPVDSVSTALDDESVVRREAMAARALGFTGKLCIHPRQVGAVREAMVPSEAQVTWAKEVVAAAAAGGAVRVAGQMVDGPVVARAQRVLAAATGGVRV